MPLWWEKARNTFLICSVRFIVYDNTGTMSRESRTRKVIVELAVVVLVWSVEGGLVVGIATREIVSVLLATGSAVEARLLPKEAGEVEWLVFSVVNTAGAAGVPDMVGLLTKVVAAGVEAEAVAKAAPVEAEVDDALLVVAVVAEVGAIEAVVAVVEAELAAELPLDVFLFAAISSGEKIGILHSITSPSFMFRLYGVM